MYAVIKTGGKQYRVAPNDIIDIEKINGDPGQVVEFTTVLMLAGDGEAQIGAPTVTGVTVAGEMVKQGRGDKVIIFKKRRRHNYRRKKGHRQELSTVRITEILTGGARAANAVAQDLESKPNRRAQRDAAQALVQGQPGGTAAQLGTTPGSMPGGQAAGSTKASSGAGAKVAKSGGEAAAKAIPANPAAAKASAGQAGSGAGAGRAFTLLSAPDGSADDLTLLSGVGPKINDTLHAHGIYHFWQIAAMTDTDIAQVEKDLAFPGRVGREEWVAQAKELMAGQAPRAKVDRDRVTSGAVATDKFVRLSSPQGPADDLTLLSGIGPKINDTLHEHGIYHFWQIAAMVDGDIAEVEKDLAFPGRIGREEWVAQAKELMAGKAPRAKVDRERQAAGCGLYHAGQTLQDHLGEKGRTT